MASLQHIQLTGRSLLQSKTTLVLGQILCRGIAYMRRSGSSVMEAQALYCWPLIRFHRTWWVLHDSSRRQTSWQILWTCVACM